MERINLLPWREEERAHRLIEFLFMLGAGLIVAIVISLAVHMVIEQLIANQDERNQYVKNEARKLQKAINTITEIKKEKSNLTTRMNAIQQLQKMRPQIVHMFDNIVDTVPKGIYLTKFIQQNHDLTIIGIATANTIVSAYMKRIDKSEWLERADLTIVKSSGQKFSATSHSSRTYREFKLKVIQREESKSKAKAEAEKKPRRRRR